VQERQERDARAQELANRFIKFVTDLVPLLVQVRKDFLEKHRDEVIYNCKTWGQYCETVLNYSQQHINRLIRDGSPAAKPRLPKPEQAEQNVQVEPEDVPAKQEATRYVEGLIANSPDILPSPSFKPQIIRFVEAIDEAKARGLWEFITETYLRGAQ
jgi:hypothetical protein